MCQKLLERTKVVDDCLLWQGAIDDKGLAVAKVDNKTVKVHRYLKLYEVARSAEQIASLKSFDVTYCNRFTHCLNTAHMQFRTTKPKVEYQGMPDWRKVYGTEVRGLTSGS